MKPIKKFSLNVWTDSLAFAAFLFLISTGIILKYLLPPGSGKTSALWGMDRHEWGNVHFWISVVFFSVLVIHLVLHWNWITCVLQGKKTTSSGHRFGLGIIGLIALVLIALAPVLSPVQHQATAGIGIDSNDQRTSRNEAVNDESSPTGEHEIYGSMTVEELAESQQVDVQTLLDLLKLPSSVNPDEKIGRLCRNHGMTLWDVRSAVERYQQERGKQK